MHVGLPSLPRGLTSLFTAMPPKRRNNVVDVDSPVSTKKKGRPILLSWYLIPRSSAMKKY